MVKQLVDVIYTRRNPIVDSAELIENVNYDETGANHVSECVRACVCACVCRCLCVCKCVCVCECV